MQFIRGKASSRVTTVTPVPLAQFLFYNPLAAWIWLVVRLIIGYEWLSAGLDKLTGYSFAFDSFGVRSASGPWVFNARGPVAIRQFLMSSIQKSTGAHASVPEWYAAIVHAVVLPNAGIFSYLVTFGEVCVGLGLILGAFTGIAAFFGAFMNLNYLFAGSISTNPLLALGALFLVLAWRIAGYYGCDRFLIPLLKIPWAHAASTPRTTQEALSTEPAVVTTTQEAL
jgi:thiosulfate dehydrogenase [quinone] large subunit